MDSEIALKIQVIRRVGASLRADDTSAIYFLKRVFAYQNEDVKDAVAVVLAVWSHPEFKQALTDVAAFVWERENVSVAMVVPPCASLFLQSLGNSERYLQQCAIYALVQIGSPVVSDLLEVLTRAEDNGRGFAASALGRIGDPVAIPTLTNLLRDRKKTIRDCAGAALARYGSSALPAVVEELKDERSRMAAVETLGWIGDASAAPALLQSMQTANPDRTWEYWKAFQRIGLNARPFLLEAMQDPYEFRRASAVRALGALAGEADVPLFLTALQDAGRFGRVRVNAAHALMRLQDASAVPALRAACRDRLADVRESAVTALGACGGPEILPDVIQRLGDSNFRVQQAASSVLMAIGKAAIPSLEQALSDPTETVRNAASKTLRVIEEDVESPKRIRMYDA